MESEQISPESAPFSDAQLEIIRLQLALIKSDVLDAVESLELAQRPTPEFRKLTINI